MTNLGDLPTGADSSTATGINNATQVTGYSNVETTPNDQFQLTRRRLFLSALAFYVVFVSSPNELDWHLRTAGRRVYGQLLAATTLWIGAALSSVTLGSPRESRTP